MKINSNTPLPPGIPSKKMAIKGKVNKKRLFYIFLSTFVAFFAVCTFLASWLSPSINIPGSNNDQKNPNNDPTTISSDDFKGHIDPRLKSLEERETMPGSSSSASVERSAQNIPQDSDATNASINKEQNNTDVNNNYNAQDNNIPNYDNNIPDNNNQDVDQEPEQNIDTPKPVIKHPVEKQNNGPELKDKVKAQRPSSMTKVMVGSYSDPLAARKASQALSNSNLNVTPFIKEKNGVYSLQVGSFSSERKAESLANELRKRNLDPEVIQDNNSAN